MNIIVMVILGYLLLGVIALGLLDLITGRVRRNLINESAGVRVVASEKLALAVTIFALWIFWPFAIYAAIRG
jgi:hypothetical protein